MRNYIKIGVIALVLALSACKSEEATTTSGQNGSYDQDQDATTETINDNYEYQLPVIFHVLYNNKDNVQQYIPAARLRNLLQYVNEMYQGVYGETSSPNLKFVLAEQDESGKTLSTPGVEYVQYSGEYPIDEMTFMKSESNAKYVWDPNEYINVMMYNFKSEGSSIVLGISNLPYTPKGDNQLEGLEVVDQGYINKNRLGYPRCVSINSIYAAASDAGGYYQSDRYTNTDHTTNTIYSADIVVTLAHELGHYLGLYHVFTESEDQGNTADEMTPVDDCSDTDYCEDTPSYNRSTYETFFVNYIQTVPEHQQTMWDLLKRESCDGAGFYSDNIMDYALTQGFKISPDQRARMRNVLYYSPLVPGPKLNGVNTTTRATAEGEQPMLTRPKLIK